MTQAPGIRVKGSARIEHTSLFDTLTLDILPGAWTCLLGASGVGKSTILRLMAGLDVAASFDGEITATDGQTIADRVAYMGQSDLLLPWATTRQNVSLGARLRGEKVDQQKADRLLTQVGLTEHAAKKPGALSGGQRQRVALARTLMEDKPIILLDEPFSALDAKTRSEMQELAFELLKDRTVLLVTHDPGEAARLGQKITILDQWGLTEVEPPSAPAPRALDDPAMLQMQGALLAKLRGQAA